MTGTSSDARGTVTQPDRPGGRLTFVDVLRVALIALVIAHHAGQAYGPTGGDWPVADPGNADWLGAFFAVNAAFFMGLLFLLAGYFVPHSYESKGASGFLKGRWKRIGVPLVFFALLVHIPIAFFLDESTSTLGEFLRSSYQNGLQEVYIHLWFLGHLLLYSAVYVAWRRFRDSRRVHPSKPWSVPSHLAIAGFVVALALVTWVVRFWYPIDEWVPLFFVLATEPAHLPQYVSLFVLGAVAYRGDWFRRMATSGGMVWLGVGVVASAAVYVVQAASPARWNEWVDTGGTNIGSLIWSSWEAFICVGLSVGLIVLFRQFFNRSSRLVAAMATASYAAYILHLLLVVGLQMGLEGLDWAASAKFGSVTVLGIVLAFGLGYISRRVPGFRVILGTKPEVPIGREKEAASLSHSAGRR